MLKKYELEREPSTTWIDLLPVDGRERSPKHSRVILYRVKAIRDFGSVAAGTLGGYVESEANLSQAGNCWISDDARVFGDAVVYGDARVTDDALVYDAAQVYGGALVGGHSHVYGRAQVYGSAIVGLPDASGASDVPRYLDGARISDDAQVYGGAVVSERATVSGESQVLGDVVLEGRASVLGSSIVLSGTFKDERLENVVGCNFSLSEEDK